MSYLDKFFELLVSWRNAGAEVAKRKAVNFSSEFQLIDNPTTGAVDVFTTGGSPIAVQSTRQIVAGAGMTATPAGSDLSVDRTHDVVAGNPSIVVNPDSITVGVLQNDAMHGNLGGAVLHALATPAAHGFMSLTDKALIDTNSATPAVGALVLWGNLGAGSTPSLAASRFVGPGTVAATGIHSIANTDVAIAFRNAANTADINGIACNASNQILIGPTGAATTGQVVVTSVAGTDTLFNIGVSTVLSLGTIADFSIRPKLPASAPTAVREFGADNTTGRILMFTDGASRSGAILANVSAVQTSAFTAAWDATYRFDASGGAFTATLTTAAGNAGRIVTFVNDTDSFVPLTIDGAGAETINGSATFILAEPRSVAVLQSDGTNVHVLNRFLPKIKLSTASDTPVDALTIPLPLNSMLTVYVEASAKNSDGSIVAEWRARNSWQRTSGGTSTRVGTANGTQDSVANQFAITRPSITFGDPSVSNNATVIATGKLAVPVTWDINFRYHMVF